MLSQLSKDTSFFVGSTRAFTARSFWGHFVRKRQRIIAAAMPKNAKKMDFRSMDFSINCLTTHNGSDSLSESKNGRENLI